MKKNNIYNPKSIKNILPTPNVILPEALTNELNLIPKKEYTPVIKPIIKSLHNIPDEYLKFSQMPTTINGVSVVLSNQDQLPILRPDGNGGFINYLATYIASQSGGVQTVSGDGSTIAVNNTDPNNPIVSLLPAWVTANTNAITSAQNQANKAETDAQTANTAIATINKNGIVQAIKTPDGNSNTNTVVTLASADSSIAITSDGKGNVNFKGATQGSSNPVVNIPQYTISTSLAEDEVASGQNQFVAIFPVNTTTRNQWQNYGTLQVSAFSPSSILPVKNLYTLKLKLITNYFDSGDVYVSVLIDGQEYISNIYQSAVGLYVSLAPTFYTTVINNITYVAIAFQQSAQAGYIIDIQVDGQLAPDGGTLMKAWAGQSVLNPPNAVTPIRGTGAIRVQLPNALAVGSDGNLYLAEQFATTNQLQNRTWFDAYGNPTVVMPGETGQGSLSNGKLVNGYFINLSDNYILYKPAVGGVITEVFIQGVVGGDIPTDITYDGTNYFICTALGSIYRSSGTANPLFQNWTNVYSVSTTIKLNSICAGNGYVAAMGNGNFVITNKSGSFQSNTPTWVDQNSNPVNIRSIVHSFFAPSGQVSILGAGTLTGTMVFVGVDANNNFVYAATGGNSTYFLNYWACQTGRGVSLNASINQVTWTNSTVGWLFACNGGNICNQTILGTGVITSAGTSGTSGINYTSISCDGTNVYVIANNGLMWYNPIAKSTTNIWTQITYSGFTANSVASSTITPFATVIGGISNNKPATLSSNTLPTPVWSLTFVPLYNSLPYMPLDDYANIDNRLATRGYVQYTLGQPSNTLPTILDFGGVNQYSGNLTANTTFTIVNITQPVQVIITSTGGFTPTFTGVKFAGGFRPSAMVNGQTDVYTFINTGTAILGAILQSFS